MKALFVRLLAIAGIAAVAITPSALAQTYTLAVNVPFDFVIGASTLPAGDYEVRADRARNTVLFDKADHSVQTRVIANFVIEARPHDRGRLVFNRYGDRYFLAEVWSGNTTLGQQLRPSKMELEMAGNTAPSAAVQVALKAR